MGVTAAQIKKCIETIAPLAQEQYFAKGKKILPSVCIAQACCESAYLTSTKMIKANAVFGIKVGNSKVHFGTAWKDKAYSTTTKECYDGKTYTNITDMFRAYDTIAESVEDYYDMLVSCSRYRGAVGETDSTKAITAIKNGGYATSPTYVNTITGIIKSNNLTKYDKIQESTSTSNVTTTATDSAESSSAFAQYKVKISISNLRIRKGPGTNYGATGKHTGKGTFTIVDEQSGTGSKKGWGKLSSGAGWISLDYATKL